jgi:hypothetical protein
MAETITVNLNVSLGSGASWAVTRQLAVAAIDLVDIAIEAGAEDVEVPIQPGGVVRLLMVTADPPAAAVTYKTSSGGSESYTLDQPHLLLGEGGVGMLEGAAAPTSLFVSNSGAGGVRLAVVVGRDLPP